MTWRTICDYSNGNHKYIIRSVFKHEAGYFFMESNSKETETMNSMVHIDRVSPILCIRKTEDYITLLVVTNIARFRIWNFLSVRMKIFFRKNRDLLSKRRYVCYENIHGFI